MESLFLDINEYLPDEEVEATNKAIKTITGEDEQYYFIESKMKKKEERGLWLSD